MVVRRKTSSTLGRNRILSTYHVRVPTIGMYYVSVLGCLMRLLDFNFALSVLQPVDLQNNYRHGSTR